jgi:hypothetical protein
MSDEPELEEVCEFTVIGLPYEGRAEYVLKNVEEDDEIRIEHEPDNPHDPKAIAAWHEDFKIGYIAKDSAGEIRRAMRGKSKLVHFIQNINFNDNDQPTSIDVVTYRELKLVRPRTNPKQPVAQSFGMALAGGILKSLLKASKRR